MCDRLLDPSVTDGERVRAVNKLRGYFTLGWGRVENIAIWSKHVGESSGVRQR